MMKMVFAVLLVCLLAGAASATGEPGWTDARTESGGLPAVHGQLAQPSDSGGGPPGADQIVYDDGRVDNAWYFYDRRVRYAMRMDPAYHPAIVVQCDIHVLTNGDPYWPWPDSHHDSIYVQVWLDPDGNGQPEIHEAWGQWAQSARIPSDTATITVRPAAGSVVCLNGSIWVGMMQDTLVEHPHAGYEGVTFDAELNHPGHQYYYGPGRPYWMVDSFSSGDLMFRVWTIRLGARGLVTKLSAPTGTISKGDTVTPKTHTANLGIGAVNSWTRLRIEHTCSTDNYIDSCWVRLDPLQMLDTTYHAWTPLYSGLYRMQCTADSSDTNWTYLTVLPRTGLEEGQLPQSFDLNGIEVGPNPVRSAATIRYYVASESRVELRILDARGRVVRTLVAGQSPLGERSAVWDARDDLGHSVARGIYFVRLETPDCRETRKVVLTR
jgi:hypothetical protein